MAGELRVLRRAPVTTLANIGVSFLLAALCYNVISLLTSSEDGIQQNSVEIVGNDLNQVYDVEPLKPILRTPPKKIQQNSVEIVRNDLNPVHDVEPLQTTKSAPKKILYWNKKYDFPDFGFGLGQEPFIKAGCRVNNCVATHDRQQLNESDAVIFFVLFYNETDIPVYRKPHQRFIFNLYETMDWVVKDRAQPTLFKMNNFFNWTMTYRRDSDIWEPHPYGFLLPRNSSSTLGRLPPDLPPNGQITQPESILKYKADPQLAKRTKLIVWFCSHQMTNGKRDVYFNELAKYVPIDIYGSCGPGTLSCPPLWNNNCDRLLDEYKFYIAAENSLCPDYVTEKFYRALRKGVVPVVYGGADYTQYGPPHSYINVANFRSPKELAEYLLLLDKNDALYMEYFRWKEHYVVERFSRVGWCKLCEKLNDPTEPVKSYANIRHYWHEQVPCVDGEEFIKWVVPTNSST